MSVSAGLIANPIRFNALARCLMLSYQRFTGVSPPELAAKAFTGA
jgi:hypothetical protein